MLGYENNDWPVRLRLLYTPEVINAIGLLTTLYIEDVVPDHVHEIPVFRTQNVTRL